MWFHRNWSARTDSTRRLVKIAPCGDNMLMDCSSCVPMAVMMTRPLQPAWMGTRRALWLPSFKNQAESQA
jgi:hypothetical protein